MDILFTIGGMSILVLPFVIGHFMGDIPSRESKRKWNVISSYKYLLREGDWLELEECCKENGMDAAIALFEEYYDEYRTCGVCTYKGYVI